MKWLQSGYGKCINRATIYHASFQPHHSPLQSSLGQARGTFVVVRALKHVSLCIHTIPAKLIVIIHLHPQLSTSNTFEVLLDPEPLLHITINLQAINLEAINFYLNLDTCDSVSSHIKFPCFNSFFQALSAFFPATQPEYKTIQY